MVDELVARLYDMGAEEEWSRLDARRTEFEVTCRALDEFLPPPPANILDIGSGPGRYAIRLGGRGYRVSLADVSQCSLDLAVARARALDIQFGAVACRSAVDLSSFFSEQFDAVLLMGPLYHLQMEDQRACAVREACRLTRIGGLVFSAFVSRYGIVRYAAKVRPEQLAQSMFLESVLQTGAGETEDTFLRTCYGEDPAAIGRFMEHQGLATIATLGCEGIVADVEDRLSSLPHEEFARWADLNYRLGRRPELVAASSHILHIGRKSAPLG
jgi:SAM-dependent methyltransferase